MSALAVVEQILAEAGTPGLQPRILGEARSEIDRQCLAYDKAYRLLGWKPSIPFQAGVQSSVAWYRKYLIERAPRILTEARA
jgi:CDP-glucose 4,6-dehydratase